jgi:hypothetical protein
VADELDPVEQVFTADVEEYENWLESAAMTAQEFADANEEASVALDRVRDTAAEAGAALDDSAGSAIGAGEAMSFTRDEWLAAAEAAARIRDAAAEAAFADDDLTASAEVAATALGHQRDEAVEASAAMGELRDAEVETAAAGDAAAAGGLPMMAVAIVALVGAIAAVAPAVLAMGAGIGAFAVFAIPTIMQVTGALGDTKAQLAALPAPIRMVVEEIRNLEGEWKSLSAQFQLPVIQLFSQAIGIAETLMEDLVPLAHAGTQAVSIMMDALGNGVDSQGFTDFLAMLTRLVVPATKAITQLAGVILGILGQAITQLAPISVPFVNMLTQLLRAAGPALIGALKFIAQVIMDIGKAITPVLGPLGKFFGYLNDHPVFAQVVAGIIGIVAAVKIFQGVMSAVSVLSNPWVLLAVAIAIVALLIITHTHQIAEAFDLVRHTVASWGHDVASALDTVRHTVASWGHDVASAFDTARHAVAVFGHDIVAGLTTAANWIASHWKEILAWLVDPVGMAVHEIITHTHQIAQAFDDLRHDAAAILDGLRHDAATAWDGLRHDAAAFADWIPHAIETAFDAARHDAAAALDGARHDAATAWDDMRHDAAAAWDALVAGVSRMVSDVLQWFAKLPGEVVSFLAKLPGEMLSIGENVIKGLINGILNAAAQIPSIMAGLASDVASYFTDPLKLFSPSRLFFEHGYNIVQGAINGVKANAPNLLATMRGLGTGVGVAGTGSSLAAGAIAPASGSSSMHVTVPVTIQGSAAGAQSPQYMQGLQTAVQEAVLRYGQLNPGNGLTTAWGH